MTRSGRGVTKSSIEVVELALAQMRDGALADDPEVHEAFLAWWDPAVVYREDPKWPGAAVYRGVDNVRAAFRGYLEVITAHRFDIEDVVEVGDAVVARVRIAGATRQSEVPYDHVWAYLVRVRDSRVVEFEAFYDPDEAVGAARTASDRPGAE
jgi:ketosteroid isomerase-like protein